MAKIPLLYPGCTAQEILDTINALIAAITGGAGQSISYNDLTDKPTLNGVEINGPLNTADLKIKITETEDYNEFNDTIATKSYVDGIQNEAVAAAESAAQTALAGKLDKDLGNIEAVNAFSNETLIPIVTESGTKKTTLADIANYTQLRTFAMQSVADTAISRERRVLDITGEQNGKNAVYAVTGGYKPGTSTLYLNGQLLACGNDYDETDSLTITMLTYLPEAEDVLIFRAIPA